VDGASVYVLSGTPQQVYILDAETLTQKATFLPEAEPRGVVYWSPVTVGGGLAFVGFAESGAMVSGLYAFDPETGQEQWNIPAQELILPAPAYADGVVYFGDSSGKVRAVDVETRSLVPGWSFQADEGIWAQPLVDGGRVYVAAMDHHLYCLDAGTGEVIWKTQVGGAMAAPPLLDDGVLYVGAYDGKVYAIDAGTGAIDEGFDFQAENWIWSTPLMAGGQLYVTSLDGMLYALDPATGSMIPPYPYNPAGSEGDTDSMRADPVQAGDNVLIATEGGRVVAVQNAQQQWAWANGTAGVAIYTTPVVRDGLVYVVGMDGIVQTLDAANGAALRTFSPPTSE